jgi:hypothetical protein
LLTDAVIAVRPEHSELIEFSRVLPDPQTLLRS